MMYIVMLVSISVMSFGVTQVEAEILPDTMFSDVFDGLKKIFESKDGCDNCLKYIIPILPICANDGSNYPNNKTLQCWINCPDASTDGDLKKGIHVDHMGLCPRPGPH